MVPKFKKLDNMCTITLIRYDILDLKVVFRVLRTIYTLSRGEVVATTPIESTAAFHNRMQEYYGDLWIWWLVPAFQFYLINDLFYVLNQNIHIYLDQLVLPFHFGFYLAEALWGRAIVVNCNPFNKFVQLVIYQRLTSALCRRFVACVRILFTQKKPMMAICDSKHPIYTVRNTGLKKANM